jgi:Mannosyltransferase (PIG-V)
VHVRGQTGLTVTAQGRHRGAVLLDGLAFVCLGIALTLLIAGPYRNVHGATALTIRASDIVVAALLVTALRHAVWPRPSIVTTISEWTAWFRTRPALSDALLVFGLTRPVVLLVGLIAVSTVGLPPESGQIGSGRQAVPGLVARFDANWYAGIAADGYFWEGSFGRQQNPAFFPAYPMLMRAGGWIVGAFDPQLSPERRLFRLTGCGLVVSLGAFLWAAWYFGRLARELMDEEHARGGLWLLASYPFAMFFSAAYTESLFLLTAVGAWYSLRHRQFTAASLWGLLAGLARPNGFFLCVPLGLIVLGVRDGPATTADPDGVRSRLWSPTPVSLPALAAAAMPVVGMLVFTAYLHRITGAWFAWARLHAAWGRVFTAELPLTGVARGSDSILALIVQHPYDALNLIGLILALATVWTVWRRVGPAWALFILISVLPPLFAGGLLSMGRLTATLFPIFLALGAALSVRATPAVVAAFGILQGLVAVLFFTWRSMY